MRPLPAAVVTLVALANNGRALLGKTDFSEVKTASYLGRSEGGKTGFRDDLGGGSRPPPCPSPRVRPCSPVFVKK